MEEAVSEFRTRCNEFAFSHGDDEWLDTHERALLAAIEADKAAAVASLAARLAEAEDRLVDVAKRLILAEAKGSK